MSRDRSLLPIAFPEVVLTKRLRSISPNVAGQEMRKLTTAVGSSRRHRARLSEVRGSVRGHDSVRVVRREEGTDVPERSRWVRQGKHRTRECSSGESSVVHARKESRLKPAKRGVRDDCLARSASFASPGRNRLRPLPPSSTTSFSSPANQVS